MKKRKRGPFYETQCSSTVFAINVCLSVDVKVSDLGFSLKLTSTLVLLGLRDVRFFFNRNLKVSAEASEILAVTLDLPKSH